LIERNEVTPDPSWRHAEAWPWPLRIYTLGRFSVVKNGAPLRFSGKAQRKPLELLKALIAFGGRDVAEARLADALWSEAEGDAAAQALATTLFRLRKLVGEQAIRRQDSRLTLDPRYCWVDCWAFERISNDALGDALLRRARLEKLHQGPFLEGDDDAAWAQPMRDRLKAKLTRSLGAAAGEALSRPARPTSA
jgi:DNA-binding SARP family transcriptional activator